MNHLTVFLSIAIFTGVLVFHGDAFAQTTPYPPQQPTKNAPSTRAPAKTAPTKIAPNKTQTTKTETRTSQSQFHQTRKEHGHGYSHGGGGVGVGIGATIDLGGIGQRRPEADPFAVSARPPSPRTQEKPEKPKTTTKSHEASKLSDFADVELTGEKAKSEIAPADPFRDVRLTGEQAKAEN